MTYNTKYNIGDKFWTMVDNKVLETEVKQISIVSYKEVADASCVNITEVLYRFSRQDSDQVISEKEVEKFFFPTKQALLESL